MDPFVHDTNPARIVFGAGKVAALGDEVERLGCSRTLVVCTPGRTAMAEELSASTAACIRSHSMRFATSERKSRPARLQALL